ncbi:hypothetical protein ABPG75_011226 [Micractinium tetrahymenae]
MYPPAIVLLLLALWNTGAIRLAASACFSCLAAACQQLGSIASRLLCALRRLLTGQQQAAPQEAVQDLERGADAEPHADAGEQPAAAVAPHQPQGSEPPPPGQQGTAMRSMKWAVTSTGFWVSSLNSACVMVADATSWLKCVLPWPYFFAVSALALALFLALTYPWGFERWRRLCDDCKEQAAAPPGVSLPLIVWPQAFSIAAA